MSTNTKKDEQNTQFIGTAPYFVVRDVLKSVDYYHNILGFSNPPLWGDPPVFAMPSRDGFIFMLNQAKPETEIPTNRNKDGYWDAYIWVKNADALFAEFKEKGAMIDYELCIQREYGMKEFAVRDPDGYVIAFGQDIEGE